MKPDFICIGYEKSGTTWLYNVLKDHPEIEMPPVKEIRYLSEGLHIPSVTFVRKYFSKHWHFRHFRSTLKKRVKLWVRHPRLFGKDKWFRSYLFSRHTDSWYSNLFASDKISGDITPTYTYMSNGEIADISSRFPNTKIIILLRNPADRIWSKMKMNLSKHTNQPISEFSDEHWSREVERFINLGYSTREVITNWQLHFDDVFVGFFDDIITAPEEMLKNIYDFLALENRSFFSDKVSAKINVGIAKDMPGSIKKVLSDASKKEVNELTAILGDRIPESWGDR